MKSFRGEHLVIVSLLVLFSSSSTLGLKSPELKASAFVTKQNSNFNSHIEGLNVSPVGNVYATQYGPGSNTLGQLYPRQSKFYSDTDSNSYFNGMHFLNKSVAFVVDSSDNRRLVRLELDDQGSVVKSSTHCSDQRMLPLNELAISFKAGLIFLSAMNWTNTSTNTDGQIWVCSVEGGVKAELLDTMGGVNGIELSFDETTLLATETFSKDWIHVSSKIWKYTVVVVAGVKKQSKLKNKKVFVDMGHVEDDSVRFAMDGIKMDGNGNLLAVRYGGSSVAVFDRTGTLINRIRLNFKNPSNLELVEIQGKKTIFICGACGAGGEEEPGCVDFVPWSANGRSWDHFGLKGEGII